MTTILVRSWEIQSSHLFVFHGETKFVGHFRSVFKSYFGNVSAGTKYFYICICNNCYFLYLDLSAAAVRFGLLSTPSLKP